MCIWKIDGTDDPESPDEPQVLYSDTDSIYMKNTRRNREIIAEWNDMIYRMNMNLPKEFYDLGAFDWVGKDKKTGEPYVYRFKTLGAKRYLKFCPEKGAEVTVAGLPKQALEKLICRPFATDNSYILYENPKKKQGRLGFVDIDELFYTFRDEMFLACDYSEKSRSIYYPDKYNHWEGCVSDIVTDDQGHTEEMTEITYVTILPTELRLKMQPVYMKLVDKILKERRLPV